MKTKYLSAFLIALLISISGCDKGFEELNVNPLAYNTLDPSFLFAGVQSNFAGDTWHYEANIVQQIILIISGQEAAGNHNIHKNDFSSAPWSRNYGILKQVMDILKMLEGNTTRSNLYNMAKILKVWSYMNLVDNYGDVPFTEALQGYYTANFFPKYDKQADIYAAIETELIEAIDGLDAAKAIEKNDMYYDGNIAKWKKFGNSLLLRLGMRYSKLNPTKAQTLVQRAVDPAKGGLILTNADNVVVPFNSTQNNPVTGFCRNSTRQNWHAGRPLVDFLKNNNDPRTPYMICHYSSPTTTSGGTRNTTVSVQLGAPVGYDPTSITSDPLYPGTYASNVWKYSFINRQTIGKVDGLAFLMTAAQTNLLLAEATARGWISTGTTAQQYYENAITQAMTQPCMFSETRAGASPITSGQITTYLAEPNIAYKSSGTLAEQLEQINTQYWLACFTMWDEAWNNFRRSGYPALARNNYPGADPVILNSSDGFIRRLKYPDSEYNYNKANVEAAATSIGGDNMATRVFWDKQ